MTSISLTIDGRSLSVRSGSTILQAARRLGISIPTLCHAPGQRNRSVCRICVVAVDNSPRLVPACSTLVRDGMTVETDREDVIAARRTLMEFILAEHRECGEPTCLIERLAESMGIDRTRFVAPTQTGRSVIRSDFVTVISERCVHCDRCIQACTKDRRVLTRAGHGAAVHVRFGTEETSAPVCSVCGDCVSVCPAGGLLER